MQILEAGNNAQMLDGGLPQSMDGGFMAEQFESDQIVLEELRNRLPDIAGSESLRLFHDRIAACMSDWQNSGRFISHLRHEWPAVQKAREAYEKEISFNLPRYFARALKLLSLSSPAAGEERMAALERAVGKEIRQASCCLNPLAEDYTAATFYWLWQDLLKSFAQAALGSP